METPQVVLDLVDRFECNRDAYCSNQYNETQARHEFIDPLFLSLGWDVNNAKGYAEAYKEVIHEDAIKVGGATKAPDYCFRIGGVRKFFVEAKRPGVNIKDDENAAYQLRRYAWSAKLPLSILTDFEEFAVYDCRIKPAKTDKASMGRVLYLTVDQYAEQWDEIEAIFSQEAIWKGSFDKYIESTKRKKGTAEVDTAFLKEIEAWRDVLARNISIRNVGLSNREVNFAVQRTIDRLIFLRICEDRGIETYGQLMALENGTQTYKRLCQIFRRADERYNSGLFHFQREKDRPEPPDGLTLSLAIDDKALKGILKELYYPESPYEFSVLPADILGQVYEQFLGKVIRLTPAHRAVVEDKPEVKKAGGVYYTPTYIVDYIVEYTVGKLLDGKTPNEVAKLRVLDPACGSGSFLLGAYQTLLDWHLKWYSEHEPEKHTKGRQPKVFRGPGGDWRLTTSEKKRILLNNIYGVDIDPQAVEVTKLSLLLKVLEGENAETLGKSLRLFHERALPDLADNIKCGNSLIGPDFYEGKQLSLIDEEERYRINAFDWNTEFPHIFPSPTGKAHPSPSPRGRGQGEGSGFDAVIGNPPYVRQEALGEQKMYFQQMYDVFHGTADLYVYFIERGVSLLRSGGLFCYIVADKWMRANYGRPIRKWLREQGIEEVTDFGDQPVFRGPTTYPCILRIRKGPPAPSFSATQIRTLDFADLEEYVRSHSFRVDASKLDDGIWSLVDERTQRLLSKLLQEGAPLGSHAKGCIHRGILTGLNRAFVIDDETRESLVETDPSSNELIKPFLLGRDVRQYLQPSNGRYLILIPKGWTRVRSGDTRHPWEWFKEEHPAIAGHLEPYAESAQRRYDKGEYWWELRACEYYGEFEKSKIILPAISRTAAYCLDEVGFYSNDKTSIIVTDDLHLLAVLNSRVCDFVMHAISSTKRGGYYEYKPMYLEQLPICAAADDSASTSSTDRLGEFAARMLKLHGDLQTAKTAHDKNLIQRQIDATDKQIDQLVYELYGLTDKEIRIVEEATR